ncbi:MAG: hypothetical protein LBG96_09555 [Tannerella sp.]|jgi:hypothetical protein|nr:hypothetical protein [Tannerella sp.]
METKNTTKWYRYVLEAKLVTENGLCISPATGWIENPSGEYDKQDCERKAFARLSEKIKKHFPRLPLCILADRLYPYADVFGICEQNDWEFIFVLQDKSLKSVQEELILPRRQKPNLQTQKVDHNYWIDSSYHFVNDIVYQNKYTLNWLQCTEKRTERTATGKKTEREKKTSTSNFEYVTNIRLATDILPAIATSGRLRWKIENEGFNTKKNNGYGLQHKYSRVSYTAMKNYYTLLQIAHLINQLTEKSRAVVELLKIHSKRTLKHLWNLMTDALIWCVVITENADVKICGPAP